MADVLFLWTAPSLTKCCYSRALYTIYALGTVFLSVETFYLSKKALKLKQQYHNLKTINIKVLCLSTLASEY